MKPSSTSQSPELRLKELVCVVCKQAPDNLDYLKSLVLYANPNTNPKFECPSCYLSNQDPLTPVVDWLVTPRLMVSNQQYQMKITDLERKRVYGEKGVIQIRCIKLDSRTKYIIRFPDKCEVKINGNRIKSYLPLETSISTKFRRDEKLDIEGVNYNKTDSLTLNFTYENVFDENGKNSVRPDRPMYIFGVCVVKRLLPEDVIDELIFKNSIGEDQFKALLKCNFEFEEKAEMNIALEEVKVTNKCSLTYKNIQYPGRVESLNEGVLVHPPPAFLPAEPPQDNYHEPYQVLAVSPLQSTLSSSNIRFVHGESVQRDIRSRQGHMLLQRRRVLYL